MESDDFELGKHEYFKLSDVIGVSGPMKDSGKTKEFNYEFWGVGSLSTNMKLTIKNA